MLVKQIQKLKSIFMKKFSLLLFLFSLSFATLVNSCKQEASCTDGKQNQGETGIDCGDAAGKCPPCENAVSCSNGVQDGGELGVDCGGPCPNACQTNPTCTCLLYTSKHRKTTARNHRIVYLLPWREKNVFCETI